MLYKKNLYKPSMPGILLNIVMQRIWIPTIVSASGVLKIPEVFSYGEAGLKIAFVTQTFLSVFVNRQ